MSFSYNLYLKAHRDERLKRLNPLAPPRMRFDRMSTRRRHFYYRLFRGVGNCWVMMRPKWGALCPLIPPNVKNRIDYICFLVCSKTGASLTDIISQRRDQPTAHIRQRIMWLAKKKTLHSLPEIGRTLGGRDHTTVLHGIRKIDKDRLADSNLDAWMSDMEARIDAELGPA